MPKKHALKLLPPVIRWNAGIPQSITYTDIFYNQKGGALESRHVFLEGCGLPERWKGQSCFSICEIGFGSGLNFFVTLDLWEKEREKGQILWYIAVEKHPWSKEQIEKNIQNFPYLAPFAQEIYDKLPPPLPGFYLVHIEKLNVFLLFLQGDAREQLPRLDAKVDAWYLDGFKPSIEDGCWSEEVIAEIKRCSHRESILSTFSCARRIKDVLSRQEITFQKKAGCLGKREFLVATFPVNSPLEKTSKADRINILGDGVAGSAVANAAKRRGITKIQINKKEALLPASTIPVALVHPRVTEKLGGLSQLSIQGYFYLKDWLKEAMPSKDYRLEGVFCIDKEGNKELEEGGFVFMDSFKKTLRGKTVPQATLDKSVEENVEKGFLNSSDPSVIAIGASDVDPQWIIHGSVLIVSYKEAHNIVNPIHLDGYIIPMDEKTVLVGSTFAVESEDKKQAIDRLMLKLKLFSLSTKGIKGVKLWQGRRVNKPGRYPLCFKRGNTWLLNALGSHGVTRCMIMAEHIVSKMTGQPDPIPRDISKHFNRKEK